MRRHNNDKYVEYYQYPNGKIIKSVRGDQVYVYDTDKQTWIPDITLTVTFAWDRPYGEPCRDLRSKIDISGELPPVPARKDIVIGQNVFLGAFPQDGAHDYLPVEWMVLGSDGRRALLLAKYGLIASGYCDIKEAQQSMVCLEWEHSRARRACQYFYSRAFAKEEQKLLCGKRTIQNGFGSDCMDKVFLLSEQEVNEFLPLKEKRKCSPSLYAGECGAWIERGTNEDYAAWWILPESKAVAGKVFSPSGEWYPKGIIYPKAVFPNGDIQFHGRNVYHTDFVIRPGILIDLSKLI